ncbi:zinc transporter foi isoform X1 [Neodiprion lecontei]|uniref:Zinc transporter foi isoform X1 n=2 Tax=Neodiprion lecontei TaxID=441921 RepID=A0A6J0BYA3_NEOLC|nr:zinc transporter foi isoform X1 [Neodiprion lecontei]XP_046597008.1 zinc transporter foi isoform X1 [Neodiprion lecontei]XP_046597009.1 zinc transporter foi isoform X1 [Neodiprion lecontei]
MRFISLMAYQTSPLLLCASLSVLSVSSIRIDVMSQNFVTVCVVCVLCAAHAPCSAHTDGQISRLSSLPGPLDLIDSANDDRLQPLKHQISSREIGRIKNMKDAFDPLESEPGGHELRLRKRRHTDDDDESNFTKRIFRDYGNGDSMTIEGFERLLQKLRLQEDDNCTSVQSDKFSRIDDDNLTNNTSQPNNGLNKSAKNQRCLRSKELLDKFAGNNSHWSESDNNTTLPGWLLERICPALVYQLASSDPSGCIQFPENLSTVAGMTVGNESEANSMSQHMWQVWIWSSLSILIISLCGLLGVVVIPVMNKTYYHQFIQFLVALAVGTLCGDALIHLLPHAMMSSGHEHDHHSGSGHGELLSNTKHDHDTNMWKGFVAMMGLVLFFFTEKALTMIAEWRKSHQRRTKLPARVKVMREPADTTGNSSSSDKHCKHKYSSYPYCYGEITTETQDNHHNRQHNNHQITAAVVEEEKPLTSNSNAILKSADDDVDKRQDEDWKMDEAIINHANKNSENNDPSVNEVESYTVIIREHETKHHGHTHSHGHVHSAPESMSSVAWMVIMGDGLHNFTDGMAIGAAFAANIPGGFSTAIAVLCHELPHELGDFAVLLKAGMSAKQAVFYNLLSSVLCLFGMVFGILLGADPSATSWIFAAAAGMFIYIALVDMIPELTSSHSAEGGSQWQCVLQAMGLATGLGIMLIIALYEHDLKQIFQD